MGNIILFFAGQTGQFSEVADLLITRLQEAMARQRFNYKSLSIAAGLGETTVRDIIIGRARNPRRDTLQKIARILGMPLSYFLVDETAAPPLEETGKNLLVTASSVREHGYPATRGAYIEPPPDEGGRHMPAVRLSGDSMLPFLPAGSVLYYRARTHTGFEALLGKLCVVQSEGFLNAHVIEPGALYGKYNLASYNAKTLEDMEIFWCAPVVFIKLPE